MVLFTTIQRLLVIMRRSRRAGLALILGLVLVAVVGNAVTFMLFDGPAKPELGWGDALWYSVISITTIGYGDFSATSLGARLGTVVFIVLVGLSSFTILLGMFADIVLELSQKGQRGMSQITDRDHILLVNYPGQGRINQVLRELRGDGHHCHRPVVLVTDALEQSPLTDRDSGFVRGSPLDEETWQQAGAAKAHLALILPNSYTDSNADAVSAAIASELLRHAPQLRIVAEVLDEKRRCLFKALPADRVSVVCGLQVAGNLLVQELADPGVSLTLEEVSSNLRGSTMFSARVDGEREVAYNDLAKHLLDRDANLLSVIRGEETFTTFRSLRSRVGDRVTYVGTERLSWDQLLAELA